jgi:hypothetical protein
MRKAADAPDEKFSALPVATGVVERREFRLHLALPEGELFDKECLCFPVRRFAIDMGGAAQLDHVQAWALLAACEAQGADIVSE